VQTALRETQEEAGIEGTVVGRRVGSPVEFFNGHERVRVEYFLIEARSESDDTDGREKRWFPLDQAIAAVSFDSARALLREAATRLRTNA